MLAWIDGEGPSTDRQGSDQRMEVANRGSGVNWTVGRRPAGKRMQKLVNGRGVGGQKGQGCDCTRDGPWPKSPTGGTKQICKRCPAKEKTVEEVAVCWGPMEAV